MAPLTSTHLLLAVRIRMYVSCSSPEPVDPLVPYIWLLTFLAAWTSRHRISETALTQLLVALKSFFPMLEGTVLVLRPDAAGVPQPAILLMEKWPLSMKGVLRATSQAQTPFDKYVLCPKPECGGVWKLDDLQAIDKTGDAEAKASKGLCQRVLTQSTESPRVIASPDVADGSEPVRMEMDEPRCGERLFKTTYQKKINTAEMNDIPHQLFPYGGLVPALQSMLLRPDFERQCEHWRALYNANHKRIAWEDVEWDEDGWPVCSAENPGPVMSDVMDGQLWEDYMFVDDNQRPYLDAASVERANKRARSARFRANAPLPEPEEHKEERKDQSASRKKRKQPAAASTSSAAAAAASHAPLPDASLLSASRGPPHALLAQPGVVLALAVNVDWFQRDKSGAYSMGGVYATVLNLPHGVRNLMENLIVLGILPGPKPTSRQALQGAIQLLVEELNTKLFDGVMMATFEHPEKTKVRAFLFNIVCDTDARAPMGGFLSHAATKGCAYCCQSFQTRVGRGGRDFSWSHTISCVGAESLAPLRTDQDHRASAIRWAEHFPDIAAQDNFASVNGSRYCALMDLKYFDTVRGAPLDAMHNIYLGICKALFYVLIDPYSVPAHSEEVKIYNTRFKPKEAPKKPAPVAAAAAAASSAKPRRKAAKRHRGRGNRSDAEEEEEEEEEAEEAEEEEEEEEAKADEYAPGMVVLPALLGQADLERLQEYMLACSVPRDVGQIPGKISRKMSKFKAAEWANWASIFAVPHLGELMRARAAKEGKKPKFRFEGRHLKLYIELRDVAVAMRSNHCTPFSIRALECQLLRVVKTTEKLFGPNVIKPNMHFCLHLGPMLMDLGPQQNWSCNGYERVNWQLSNLPMNIAFAETCTMRRALQVISVSHHARTRFNACQAAGPTTAGPSAADYQMIQRVLCGEDAHVVSNQDAVQVRSRITASGARQMTYRWMQPGEFERFKLALDIVGSEPYPGLLRETGSFDATLGSTGPATANDKRFISFVSKENLINYLMTHYVRSYAAELTATQTDEALHEKMDSAVKRKTTDTEVFFKLAQKCFHVLPDFTVYSTLDLCGQVFGSRRCASHKNSFVYADFLEGEEWVPFYAQVNFYFTHAFAVPSTDMGTAPPTTTWKSVTHHFAHVRWFKSVASVQLPLDGDDDAAQCLASSSPYLSLVPDPIAVADIICIQRLAGRWIACRREGKAGMMQALRIPFSSRIHS